MAYKFTLKHLILALCMAGLPLTTNAAGFVEHYRAQLWVNGYQFGKYVNHIGPQTKFPVPQGKSSSHI